MSTTTYRFDQLELVSPRHVQAGDLMAIRTPGRVEKYHGHRVTDVREISAAGKPRIQIMHLDHSGRERELQLPIHQPVYLVRR